MDIRFEAQAVLVTGAGTGIGAAIARAFGAAGAQVGVHYNRSVVEARQVATDIEASGGQAELIQADLSDVTQVESVVEAMLSAFGRIDILVNNAGTLARRVPTAVASDEIYQQVMRDNFASVFRVCRAAIPVMQAQDSGNIINVTSMAARTGGAGGSVLFAASKGAVSTFTRGLARELAPFNVRVNAIAPGVILTPFHERFSTPEMIAGSVKAIPMKRAGRAEECIGAVFYLASNALSSYVTGQIIEINGGQHMP